MTTTEIDPRYADRVILDFCGVYRRWLDAMLSPTGLSPDPAGGSRYERLSGHKDLTSFVGYLHDLGFAISLQPLGPRGGSRYVCTQLPSGASLAASGPPNEQ